MSDNPLYDETLSDRLRRARLRAEAAEARAALAEEAERVATARVDLAERQGRVRDAIAQAAVEAASSPEPELLPATEPAEERAAPPVPSIADLLRPNPGVSHFLDSLLGDHG